MGEGVVKQDVKAKGITMSMSRKGTPEDNALIESFHAAFNTEMSYLEGLTLTIKAIDNAFLRLSL